MSILAKHKAVREAHGALRAAGRDPFSVRFESILSATTGVLDGRQVLLLGTNNYLGLTFDAECVDSAVAAARSLGTGTTGSRVANGSYAAHSELERRLAEFYGRRHAMVFSTGYQANLGTISALTGRDDVILFDADSHASIYDACKLTGAEVIRFRHNDPADLERRLRRLEGRKGDRLVIVEGIYSMLGDRAPLREIAAVTRAAGAYLLVDEAHSLGVLGERGRGQAEAAGIEADIIVGTFSKSLGSVGGFCVSDMEGFEVLRLVSRPYMFTASLPPSVVASVTTALDQVEARPELRARVNGNGEHLYRSLTQAGFALGPEPGPIVSVRLPSVELAVRYWNLVLEAGVYVNLALPPATPTGDPLLRASVSAAHRPEDIELAAATIIAIGRDLGVIPSAGIPAARASASSTTGSHHGATAATG